MSRYTSCAEFERNNLLDREILSGENPVKPFESNSVLPVNEVGDVGLLKTRLACKTCARQTAIFYATEKFETKKFVEILNFIG
jgi:hypothetical protein